MKTIDLFCGGGGLSLGLKSAGFDAHFLTDLNPHAISTVTRNAPSFFKSATIHQSDIKDLDFHSIGGADFTLVGGPPCQPFSFGGKSLASADPRDMWPQAIRALAEMKPAAFLFENVKGLLRPGFKGYVKLIEACLRRPSSPLTIEALNTSDDPDYVVQRFILNAADFGTAQHRQRVFFVGIRRDLARAPVKLTATHTHDRLLWDKWITGTYWSRHRLLEPATIPLEDRVRVRTLKIRKEAPPERPWRTLRDAICDLGDPDGINQHNFQGGARPYPGHTGSTLDSPAKTIKAGNHGVPGGENMIAYPNSTFRYLSIREVARLQGFPDDYSVAGTWGQCVWQLGNAVPVELATAVGKALLGGLANAEELPLTGDAVAA